MLNDGWVVAAPADVGLDAARLSGLDAFLRHWPKRNVHSLPLCAGAANGVAARRVAFGPLKRTWRSRSFSHLTIRHISRMSSLVSGIYL